MAEENGGTENTGEPYPGLSEQVLDAIREAIRTGMAGLPYPAPLEAPPQVTPFMGSTTNLGLRLPGLDDLADVADLNFNFGILDNSVTLDQAATLTNKTLVSPIISNPTITGWTNAQHSHLNAAGAGQLDGAAVVSGDIGSGFLVRESYVTDFFSGGGLDLVSPDLVEAVVRDTLWWGPVLPGGGAPDLSIQRVSQTSPAGLALRLPTWVALGPQSFPPLNPATGASIPLLMLATTQPNGGVIEFANKGGGYGDASLAGRIAFTDDQIAATDKFLALIQVEREGSGLDTGAAINFYTKPVGPSLVPPHPLKMRVSLNDQGTLMLSQEAGAPALNFYGPDYAGGDVTITRREYSPVGTTTAPGDQVEGLVLNQWLWGQSGIWIGRAGGTGGGGNIRFKSDAGADKWFAGIQGTVGNKDFTIHEGDEGVAGNFPWPRLIFSAGGVTTFYHPSGTNATGEVVRIYGGLSTPSAPNRIHWDIMSRAYEWFENAQGHLYFRRSQGTVNLLHFIYSVAGVRVCENLLPDAHLAMNMGHPDASWHVTTTLYVDAPTNQALYLRTTNGSINLNPNAGNWVVTNSNGTGYLLPGVQDSTSLGAGSNRWTQVVSANGSIVTSHVSMKEAFSPLDPVACAQAVLDTDWMDFRYLPPRFVDPKPREKGKEGYDEDEAPEAFAQRVEEATTRHVQYVAETAPYRKQKGYVLGSPDFKVADLFGLEDRESASPKSDLAVVACALQGALQRIAALEGAGAPAATGTTRTTRTTRRSRAA